MSAPDPLILLTTHAISRHQRVYGGINLNERCDASSIEKGLSGWLLQNDTPLGVNLIHHEVTFSHLNTSEGSMWECDGRIESSRDKTPLDSRIQSVHSGVGLVKFSPPLDLTLPVFFGTNPSLRPCLDEIVVKMLAPRIIDIPAARAALLQLEQCFSKENRAVIERRQTLESTRPCPGMSIAVQFGNDVKSIRCVLFLTQALENMTFRCRLYRSDSTSAVASGTVLHQSAEKLDVIREHGDIAQILCVESSNRPIEPEDAGKGIVQPGKDGSILPILCFSCKKIFKPSLFNSEQLQVIDLWGWAQPLQSELAKLSRVRVMYERHPDARGNIITRFMAQFKKRTKGNVNLPFNQQPDPRPADYQRKLDKWTEGDSDLKHFLETTSCNVEARTKSLNEALQKYETQLQGRRVICPACGKGPIGLAGQP